MVKIGGEVEHKQRLKEIMSYSPPEAGLSPPVSSDIQKWKRYATSLIPRPPVPRPEGVWKYGVWT